MTRKPEQFPLNSEPITGGPILEPSVDEAALKRAKAVLGNKKRKSFAEKAIARAGKKNKPADFTLAEPYPFDLPWSVV